LTLLGAIGAIFANRGSARIGHGVLGLVSLWALIAALTFTGPAMVALIFADALAVALVALVDLTAHELTTERVVHQLEVHQPTAVNTANTAA
jgi:hypothetical protein